MESNLSLVYLAKPIYGGWVMMNLPLVLKYNFPLDKFKRTRSKRLHILDMVLNIKILR